jgi:hypothetical protein
MKVIRSTPTQLIVENTPWLFAIMLGIMAVIAFSTACILLFSGSLVGGIIVGLVSAIIFPVTLFYVVQRVQIIFDTPTNTMNIRKRTLLGYSTIAHDLHHLSHAELDTNIDGDDNTQTHCPIFVLNGGMSAGRHKMTPTHQSGHGPKRIVDAVNEWLNAARKDGHIAAPVDSKRPNP